MGRPLLALLFTLSLSLSCAMTAAADLPRADDVKLSTASDERAAEANSAQKRRRTFLLAIVGISACLGFAGLVLTRRRRRLATGRSKEAVAKADAETAAAAAAAAAAGARAGAAAATMAGAGTRTKAPAEAVTSEKAAPLLSKICPTCGERYTSASMLCRDDQTPLVLLN